MPCDAFSFKARKLKLLKYYLYKLLLLNESKASVGLVLTNWNFYAFCKLEKLDLIEKSHQLSICSD